MPINKKNDYIFYVYILASQRNGTLYIGMTNNILNRNIQHKIKEDPKSFTAKYNVNKLVYYETYQYVNDAIAREKELKRYKRQWKIELIEKDNPAWRDLFVDFE
jgi:putative endonuclease